MVRYVPFCCTNELMRKRFLCEVSLCLVSCGLRAEMLLVMLPFCILVDVVLTIRLSVNEKKRTLHRRDLQEYQPCNDRWTSSDRVITQEQLAGN